MNSTAHAFLPALISLAVVSAVLTLAVLGLWVRVGDLEKQAGLRGHPPVDYNESRNDAAPGEEQENVHHE